jgi:hypothetical protein
MASIEKTLKSWARDEPIFFTPPLKRSARGVLWKGGSAPPPPNPYATAAAQSAANKDTAKYEAGLNRYNIVNPFGTTTWSQQAPAPAAGAPGAAPAGPPAGTTGSHYNGALPSDSNPSSDPSTWTSTTNFSPEVQKIMDNYMKTAGQESTPLDFQHDSSLTQVNMPDLQKYLDFGDVQNVGNYNDYFKKANEQIDNNQGDIDTARGLTEQAGELGGMSMDRVKEMLSKPFNYDSLGAAPTANEDFRKSIEDAYYANQKSRLDPRMSQEENDMRSMLANQGITQGSEAYDREMGNFSREKTDAYAKLGNDSTLNSLQQMQALFGMQMEGRKQGVSELNYLHDVPLADAQKIQGLYSGYNNSLNQNLDTQMRQRQTVSQLAKDAQGMDLERQNSQLTQKAAGFNASIKDYDLHADDRMRQINEIMQAHSSNSADRSQMFNELGAMTGQLQPGGGNQQIGVGQTPVAQSVYNSYQGELSNYNAQMQSRNANTAAVAGLAGTAALIAFF